MGDPLELVKEPPCSPELARQASGSAVATKIPDARKLAALEERKKDRVVVPDVGVRQFP